MKVAVFTSIVSVVWGCSSSTSKNGWSMDDIEVEIESIQDELVGFKTEIESLKKENAALRGDIDGNKENIGVLITDNEQIQDEIQGLTLENSEHDQSIILLKVDLEEVNSQVEASSENIAENTVGVNELHESTTALSDDIHNIEQCMDNVYLDYLDSGVCVSTEEYTCANASPLYENWRLPSTLDGGPLVTPSHYDVNLTFTGLKEEDKDANGNFFFDGSSSVVFETNEDICVFHLHITGTYWINKIEVIVDNAHLDHSFDFNINADYQYLTISTKYKIPKSTTVHVHVSYRVQIPVGAPGSFTGLYLGQFEDASGTKQYLLSTQFEPTGARMVFPCFDEPSLKATFQFSITYKYSDYSAIFNTAIKSATQEGDWTTNTYEKTMTMSTYLLAILISPYHLETAGVSEKNVSVRIIGRKGWEDDAQFALEEAMSIVDGMSDNFAFDYCEVFDNNGMPCKSDQTGIPQFAAGAMENWGLITYKEYLLFFNEKRDDFMRRRSITSVIGHELIHQWFGNTVTCPWWDEIYINEAFGSIGGFLGLIHSKSNDEIEYQWEDEYMRSEMFLGLVADGLPTARPMVNNANNGIRGDVLDPQAISLQFDTIAYQKSGSVMLMIRGIIGDDLWTTGLQLYLRGQAYSTANWEQILSYWDDVVKDTSVESDLDGLTITEIMEPYFRQMGYPVLKIKMEEGKLSITTSRYLAVNMDKMSPESSFEYKWHVPLILQEGENRRIVWLRNAGQTTETYEVSVADNVIINPDANIWCRINFDQTYIHHAIEQNWIDGTIGAEPLLKARYIAKMMQDHYRMFNGETADEFDVSITTLLDLTGFLGNSSLEQYDTHKHRWIVWNEMSNGNIFQILYRLVSSYLAEQDESSSEYMLLQSYRDHMYNKVATAIDSYYPDKQCVEPGSGNGDGSDDRNGYDLSNARIVPFMVRYSFDYAPTSSSVFVNAHELAMGTVSSRCKFIDQSPDTRSWTFEAAVIAEPDLSELSTVTDYLVNSINDAIDSGTAQTDIVLCTNKDPDTNDPVSLYQGDCMLNAYFNALTSSANLEQGLYIMNSIHENLRVLYAERLAGNGGIAKDLARHFQSNVVLDEFFSTAQELTQFITGGCGSLSSLEDRMLVEAWATDEYGPVWGGAIDSAIINCINGVWTTNNAFMQKNYEGFKNWVCGDAMDCTTASFEQDPFGENQTY